MIEGLDKLLEESGQAGLAELRDLLETILGGLGATGQFLEQQRFPARSHRVYRLRFVIHGRIRSVIAKRMEPEVAYRNQLVIKRWLPAIGLGDNGPILLGVAAERSGQWVWHVYEDLGDRALDPIQADAGRARAAVELIAQLHTRFAEHALLPECRLLGRDLGINFYASSVRDAARCLELLRPPAVELSAEHLALRDRLLTRLHQLRDEQPVREEALAEFGGPETLLHGELWTTNAFVLPDIRGVRARLIDWDHAGVGPASYDLSTFLLRFPFRRRLAVLNMYREAAGQAGRNLPSARDLNRLFETAEFARFADCLIWPAIALAHDRLDWGFEKLAKVDEWFESWEPVLPDELQPSSEDFASF